MTLPRLQALGRAWRKHPPSHVLLAAWLGYKAPAEASGGGDLAELVALAAVQRRDGRKKMRG
jgi:hypothetical protein